ARTGYTLTRQEKFTRESPICQGFRRPMTYRTFASVLILPGQGTLRVYELRLPIRLTNREVVRIQPIVHDPCQACQLVGTNLSLRHDRHRLCAARERIPN